MEKKISILVYVLGISVRAYFKAKMFLFNISKDIYFKSIRSIFVEPKNVHIFWPEKNNFNGIGLSILLYVKQELLRFKKMYTKRK